MTDTPAASETPQDAREDCCGFRHAADALADECDRLVAQRDALQRDLAQAVGERDRLRAGIEALRWAAERIKSEPGNLGLRASAVIKRLDALLVTPDADAQNFQASLVPGDGVPQMAESAEDYVHLTDADAQDEVCQGRVVSRASWMSRDQAEADACPCILQSGHKPPCRCSHTADAQDEGVR